MGKFTRPCGGYRFNPVRPATAKRVLFGSIQNDLITDLVSIPVLVIMGVAVHGLMMLGTVQDLQ